jgi:hypothetical protein
MAAQSAPALQRAFGAAVLLVSVGVALCMVQGDDGLRYVGLAFGPVRPWGQVYPFSYFQVFSDYDPWGGYDASLRALAALLTPLPVPVALKRFIVLKLLSAGFVAGLLWLTTRRAQVAEAAVTGRGLVLGLAMMAVWLTEPVLRQLMARPFAFGTLLLLYSVGRRGALRGFLACALTLFMYPYLGWIYTGPVAIAHWLRGSRSFALGSLGATVLAFALQPHSFWGMLAALARSDAVRGQLPRLVIGELAPLSQHLGFALVSVAALLLLLPHVREPRRLGVAQVIMLLFLPVALKYARYFVDVELCMAFVAYGADALRLLERAFERVASDWRRLLGLVPRGDLQNDVRAPLAAARPRWLRPGLTLGYAAAVALLVVGCVEQYRALGRVGALLGPVPEGSLVLTSFNQQFEVLYNRPDLAVVPSCELGFPKDELRGPYLAYLNAGRVCSLARVISAGYFVEAGTDYLDPRDTGCLRLLQGDGALRLWRVEQAGRSPGPGP